MKYTTAVAAALVAGVSASYSPGWAPPSGGEGSGWGESAAPAWSAPTKSWVTEVLTAYTTYCPEATQITHGGTTYSVTEATTLTITGPATVSYPVTVSTYSACTSCTVSSAPAPPPTWSSAPAPPPESYSKPAPPPSWSSAPAPPPPVTTSAPPPAPPVTTPVAPAPPVHTAPASWSVPANGTVPKPSGTGAKTTPAGPVYTGAASALKAGSAGLAAVFGLVAYAL